MAVPQLNPQQINQYNQQRSNAGQQLLANQAQTLYQRELSALAYKNNVGKFNIDWGRRREELPTSFIQRGTLRSGLYRQGLQDYAQDRLAGANDLAIQNQLGNNQYTLQSRGHEDDYARTMFGSYGNEYTSKAALAAALKGIM